MKVKDLIDKYKDYKFTEGELVLASNSYHLGDIWAFGKYLRYDGKDTINADHHRVKDSYSYFWYCLPFNDEVREFGKSFDEDSHRRNIEFLPIDEWENYVSSLDKASDCWGRLEWDFKDGILA